MKYFSLITAFLVMTFNSVFAQDIVINKYASVLGFSGAPCGKGIIVDSASYFKSGDTILFIQMTGAVIDSSNSPSFGNVTDYRNTGNYEFNIVNGIAGSTLILRYNLKNAYDWSTGKVQVVRVPSYKNYTVSARHSCRPWDGSKGGVFAISVTDTLTLNNDINVVGKGFTGGTITLSTAHTCNKLNYYYSSLNNDAARKGLGIAEISLSKMYGRGKLANGGGGGNDHNAGGGGGGNAGTGGIGGKQFYYPGGPGCAPASITVFDIGGKGGLGLDYTKDKIFMGGGGGAGHGNDLSEKPGGAGGGIIIILANTIVGNGKNISANGSDAPECSGPGAGCQDDGTGGGGGGGVVFVNANKYVGGVNVLAKGGKGSNTYVSSLAVQYVAPGGGGGGGVIQLSASSVPVLMVTSVAGGANGVLPQYSNNPYGAEAGTDGLLMTDKSLVWGVGQLDTLIAAFKDSVASCFGRKFTDLSISKRRGIQTWSWDFGDGGKSTVQNPSHVFSGYGVYTVKLKVTDSCGIEDSVSKVLTLTYKHFANAGNDTSICLESLGMVRFLLTATGGTKYAWQPAGSVLSPNSDTTTAVINDTTTFIVTVTDAVGCVDKDTVVVFVNLGKTQVSASPSDTTVCINTVLQLQATGSNRYSWFPPTGLNFDNISNPVLTVTASVDYIVTGIDLKGCVSFDTVSITRFPVTIIEATAEGRASCQNGSAQLHATGAESYIWSPGVYCDDERSASPKVYPPSTTTFTVFGKDKNGCESMDTVTVFYDVNSIVKVPNAFTPNGDGINEHFLPVIICDFELTAFRIFNRWGQEVFYSDSPAVGWDGVFKGVPLDMGVYYYMIQGKNGNGDVLLKGDVTLIR